MKLDKKYFTYSFIKSLFIRDNFKRYFFKLINLKDKTYKLALAVALGIFIGFAIPIGFQTIVIIPLSILFRVNVLIAAFSTLISNPLTVIPMYWASLELGKLITKIDISWDVILYFINNPSWSTLLDIGTDGLITYFTGAIIQGILIGLLSYFLVYKVIESYRLKQRNKLN